MAAYVSGLCRKFHRQTVSLIKQASVNGIWWVMLSEPNMRRKIPGLRGEQAHRWLQLGPRHGACTWNRVLHACMGNHDVPDSIRLLLSDIGMLACNSNLICTPASLLPNAQVAAHHVAQRRQPGGRWRHWSACAVWRTAAPAKACSRERTS